MEIQPYRRKAQYHETDSMGIIHHANYIRWFEEARVDYMEQAGFSYRQAVDAGIDVAVLGVSSRYHAMVRFGESVDIHCEITSLSPSRMTVSYRVTDSASGELRTTGESAHCFFSGSRGRPVSLKKELPQLYTLFSRLCRTPNQPQT